MKQKRNTHKKKHTKKKKVFPLKRHLRHRLRITYAATAKNSFYFSTFPFYGLTEKAVYLQMK